MTYIIAEPCIDIKDRSCVDVCPVDCIHEAERILVIDPEECIDCFAPTEQLVTTWGLRTFAELENDWCRVLTDDGFKPAVVKRFRKKPLVEVEFAPAFEERDRYGGMRLTTRNGSRFRRTVLATPTHSWLLADGERILAANVDQVIVMFAAIKPEPHPRMLDRFLVIAEANELPVRIVINKIDRENARQFFESLEHPTLAMIEVLA